MLFLEQYTKRAARLSGWFNIKMDYLQLVTNSSKS